MGGRFWRTACPPRPALLPRWAHSALAVLAALELLLQSEQLQRGWPRPAAQLSGMLRGAGARGTDCVAGGGNKLPQESRS